MTVRIEYLPSFEPICFAACELNYYLSKISNSICFVTGERSLADAPKPGGTAAPVICLELFAEEALQSASDDSYEIEIRELNGYIRGSNPRSVLLGVYRFLTLLGCRFLRPGREFEVIPSIETAGGFNVSASEHAALRHRGVCIEGADAPENILDFIDWLPKLGYNTFFLQFELPYAFLKLWYSHKNNPLLPPEPFSLEQAVSVSARIDREMRKRGILHHRVGHGWTCSVLGQNALGWVTSDASLDEGQLRMTALVDGTRGFFGGVPINTNLCYSSPEVVSAFAGRVAEYAAAHPEVDYLHVWLADAANNHCECENCRGHLPTDLYIRILNEIDRLLTRRGLPTRIVFLIYEELLWPPREERLANPGRFVMMFAPISRTFLHSYQVPETLPEIPPYRRNHITLPVDLEENLAFLKGWQECFHGEAFDYDYPLGRAHYGDMGYLHISRVIAEDIRRLKALGLDGYVSCQELRCFLPNGLPNYVMGRFLFDPGASFEETAKEYFQAAYGEGWRSCFSYLDTLSRLCNCDYFNGKGPRKSAETAGRMRELLSCARDFASSASRLAPPASPVQALFRKHLDYHNQYCILLAEAILFLAEGKSRQMQEAWDRFRTEIRSREPEFQKALDVYRVIEVATNYTGFPSEEGETDRLSEA